MHHRSRFFLALLAIAVLSAVCFFVFRPPVPEYAKVERISLMIDGLAVPLSAQDTGAKTVGEFLHERQVALGPEDRVFPMPEAALTSGMHITIDRARTFTLEADGETKTFASRALSIGEALSDTGLVLDEDDIVSPDVEEPLADRTAVQVIRVAVTEESVEKPIPFETETKEDDELSWRKKIVTTKGEKGVERLTYRVARHDGEEVSRKLLASERTKEPVTEVVTQGTYVKLGKSHTGAASWYAYTGTLSAANPWLPLGSYVKVTNTANGKSVIVKINDRGPFGPGRIIDLDKVAFQEIASLGAGVVNVKMEEITN